VVEREQRVGHVWLVLVDVERGAGDAPLDERGDERRPVHDRTARDVHEPAARAERGEHVRRDEVPRGGAAGAGQARGSRPSGRARRPMARTGTARGAHGAPVVAHLEVEAGGAPRDRAPDPPQADDAEPLAGDARREREAPAQASPRGVRTGRRRGWPAPPRRARRSRDRRRTR
jgi:hypothetical protein